MAVDLKTIARHEAGAFGGKPQVTRHWDAAEQRSVDVLGCADRPAEGVTSWATIGASQFDNQVSGDAGPIRVELLGACSNAWPLFANMLATCALKVASGDYSVTPGIIMPGIVELYEKQLTTKHMLLTAPFLWPDDAFVAVVDDAYTVTWLQGVPVTGAELDYARLAEVRALEDLFAESDIDVFDLDRPSVR